MYTCRHNITAWHSTYTYMCKQAYIHVCAQSNHLFPYMEILALAITLLLEREREREREMAVACGDLCLSAY